MIDRFFNGTKVILIGHSLGGMIIRDYAIKNPSKIAALRFVDASHEMYNNLTQAQEDFVYEVYKRVYGENFGGTLEARELTEDTQYKWFFTFGLWFPSSRLAGKPWLVNPINAWADGGMKADFDSVEMRIGSFKFTPFNEHTSLQRNLGETYPFGGFNKK